MYGSIPDANNVPKITFLPKKIDTFENRAIGDSIFTITRDLNFVDDDATDVPTFECVFPDGGADLFQCDPDSKFFCLFSSPSRQAHKVSL